MALTTYKTAAEQFGVWDEGAFRGVNVEDWRAEFYAKHTGDSVDAKRQAFNRVRKDMVNSDLMTAHNDLYLVRESEATVSIVRQRAERDKRDMA